MRSYELLAVAAERRRLPEDAMFSGLTGAFLHSLDVPARPIDVTVPEGCGVSARAGIVLRRRAIAPEDATRRHGLPVTSLPRTLADVSWQLDLVEATVVVDMALNAGLVDLAALWAWARSRRGVKGVARLKRVLRYADAGAESPMETRLRMAIVLGGLPPPLTQQTLRDAEGIAIGRADLYYPEQRLIIEFDGGVHRSSLVADNRRQNRLIQAGYTLLRFTSADLQNQAVVVAQVRSMLRSVGAIR